MRYLIIVFLGSLLLLSGCARQNMVYNFDTLAADHQMIAVLPVRVTMTGKQPKELTPADIETIEEEDSKTYQALLHNQLLRPTRRRRPLKVGVQNINETNRLLQQAGYSIREAWQLSADEASTILGVDAVVYSEVQVTRYLSDLASYGIDVATRTAGELLSRTSFGGLIPLPNQLSRTSDVFINLSIANATDALTLYSNQGTFATDWRSQIDLQMNQAYHRLTRRVPYKRKKYKK